MARRECASRRIGEAAIAATQALDSGLSLWKKNCSLGSSRARPNLFFLDWPAKCSINAVWQQLAIQSISTQRLIIHYLVWQPQKGPPRQTLSNALSRATASFLSKLPQSRAERFPLQTPTIKSLKTSYCRSAENMAKEVIQAEEVLASEGKTTVHATFVQRAGLWLAGGVGALIALVTVGVLVFVYTHYPIMPQIDALKNAGVDPKVAIEEFKELSQVAVKNGQDLFQTIVSQALLPVLTAILGYIFGKSNKAE